MHPAADNPEDVVLMHHPVDHVAVVTLNRPQARNAISAAVAQRLDALVKQIEADPAIRVAVLTGTGTQAFCAGADLKEISRGGDRHARHTPDGGFAGFVHAPRSKLWIAAVNGAAMAGGLELMLACDFAIASSDAIFGLPEVKRGLVASAGGIFRLPRTVPRGLALEMIATGDPIDATRALSFGLVNRLVPSGEVLAEAIRIAQAVSANAPLSVATSLQIARTALDHDEPELWRQCADATVRIIASDDAREGPLAFAEHRAPRWTGH